MVLFGTQQTEEVSEQRLVSPGPWPVVLKFHQDRIQSQTLKKARV